MNEYSLGLPHFITQATFLTIFILLVMLIASLTTWSIIVDRLINYWVSRRRSNAFLNRFGHVRSLADVADSLPLSDDEPYSRLAQTTLISIRHYKTHATDHLEVAGGLSAFLIRILRQSIEDEAGRLERGLSILASIGSTAPFVGLFGTVWGIYHSLIAISLSGQSSLDKVAGPVGEALIMTAIGLAVAIPAVLGYNALIRYNRDVLNQLDSFSHKLLTLAVSGAPLEGGTWKSTTRIEGSA